MNRDALIEKAAWAVHRASGCDGCPPCDEDRQGARDALDAILPQVTTAAELEALPTGTLLVERSGNVLCRHPCSNGSPAYLLTNPSPLIAPEFVLPLTVFWQPEVSA